MDPVILSVRERLFSLQDEAYRVFQSRLMPTVDPRTVIGVRTPLLRATARELKGTPDALSFLQALPHAYYEENNLHGLLISELRGYDEAVAALNAFLPYVDNWATCDLIRPAAFRRHPSALPKQLHIWMDSSHPYTVRFGLEMLMVLYLDRDFRPEYLEWAAALPEGEYYENMMVAWFFATALAKQYEASVVFLQEHRLPLWTHNKTIQKAVESHRIPAAQKQYLQGLRRI